MCDTDHRPEHLGWVETELRYRNADLPTLRLVAQSHFGPPDRIAFIEVNGVRHDRDRRRRIRSEAEKLLRQLGYVVEVEAGRDVYDLDPLRPASAHERARMLHRLYAVCSAPGPRDNNKAG